MYIAGNTAVENARDLAQSALPNAPQQEHEPRRPLAIRSRLATLLRKAAAQELRLADRVDPRPTCSPT